MGIFRRGDNPNAVAGLFLLILLLAIAGPNILPRVTSNLPGVDEGVPCVWLRTGDDRGLHQSLIGRAASLQADPPISLRVETTPLSSDPTSELVVSIIVENETIGTIPIVITSDTAAVGINSTQPGLGVAFNVTGNVAPAGTIGTSYPEDQIHLLGPRQRCVHRIAFTVSDLAGAIGGFGNDTIIAFYRNSVPGVAAQIGGQVYNDQGLWTGVAVSEPFTISVSQ